MVSHMAALGIQRTRNLKPWPASEGCGRRLSRFVSLRIEGHVVQYGAAPEPGQSGGSCNENVSNFRLAEISGWGVNSRNS